ncbi:MAG: hypothetical protein CME69_06515 [Halobacteriovorax sp.]|nr:hypothetical protein [Halobacteriovorax sp.]
MKWIISLLLILSFTASYAQDGTGVSADGVDGATRSGNGSAEGEAESSDSNSKNRANTPRVINRYIPAGVAQFSQVYPRIHFKFVTGDILSASVFESTGLFSDVIGSDPLDKSLDRSSSLERHVGLFTFLSIATGGAHAINGIENSINKKLGIEKTSKKITVLKNLLGINILAGVYGYIATDATIKGMDASEIKDLLSKKETFAAALSMHFAFLAADEFIDKSKASIANAKLMKEVLKNPQALKIASKYSSKTGLALFKEFLLNAEKINALRKDLQKSKIALGVTQPYTIPALVGATAAEWSTYYVFAKVWDAYIHQAFISALHSYDMSELKDDINNSFCYGINQGALQSDHTTLNSSKVINESIKQLSELMYAPLVDDLFNLSNKLLKLEYLQRLFEEYTSLEDIDKRNDFLMSLLDKDNELKDLNMHFIESLINEAQDLATSDLTVKEFKHHLTAARDATSTPEKRIGTFDASAALREHRRTHKDFFTNRLKDSINRVNTIIASQNDNLSNEDNFFTENINKSLDEIEMSISDIQRKSQKISGMSFEDIEASHKKYGIDPISGKWEANSLEQIPEPKTVYDLILVQKIYTHFLVDATWSEHTKKEIIKLQQHNELSLYSQSKNWEDIQSYHQEIVEDFKK